MRFLLAALLLLQPAAGTLRVTVVDQTNAVIVGATVTVTPTEGAAAAAAAPPVQTTEAGVAVIPALAPGRYTIQAEFPVSKRASSRMFAMRAGENRQVAILHDSEAGDGRHRGAGQAAGSRGPQGPSFGTALTRDQIDALSDDPSHSPAAAAGHGGPRRGHPHRRLRGRRAAAEGADPIDPHRARSVCRGVSQRRRRLDRDHHAAGHRPDALLLELPRPRRCG